MTRVLKNDPVQQGLAIDPDTVRALIALTRAWLDIGDQGQARPLKELVPDGVLQALQAGERVQWQGWMLKTLPPRRIGGPLQAPEWAAGILAVSAHELLSELRVNTECVRRICEHIQERERRQIQARKDEALEAGLPESELEDG